MIYLAIEELTSKTFYQLLYYASSVTNTLENGADLVFTVSTVFPNIQSPFQEWGRVGGRGGQSSIKDSFIIDRDNNTYKI